VDEEIFAHAQRVLSEPKRIQILSAIRKMNTACDGVACSTVLKEMSVSQSTFSHHVAELVRVGFVSERKEGRFSMLSVNEEAIRDYLDELEKKMIG
jgi:DNA-binding transcriptional ArsR family regulator